MQYELQDVSLNTFIAMEMALHLDSTGTTLNVCVCVCGGGRKETPPYVVMSSQTPQCTNSTELSDLLSAIMLSERMVCVVGFKAKARRGAGDGGACVEHMCTCTDTYTRMVWLKVKTNTESSYILVLV